MFSVKEKQLIAAAIEKVLLDLKHPEMPTTRPRFQLHVEGAEAWSYADILPNWKHEQSPTTPNPWNEIARDKMKPEAT